MIHETVDRWPQRHLVLQDLERKAEIACHYRLRVKFFYYWRCRFSEALDLKKKGYKSLFLWSYMLQKKVTSSIDFRLWCEVDS